MTELMIAIAVWCGNVTPITPYSVQEKSKKDIQQCRERLIKCVTNDPAIILPCFQKEKYD